MAETFSVRRVLRDEAMGCVSELERWKSYSENMSVLTAEKGVDGAIFTDSEVTISLVLTAIQLPWKNESVTHFDSSVLICRDTDRKIQAIAIVRFKSSKLILDNLASNPHNLRHFLHTSDRVRGAGSAVLKYLIQQEKPIRLYALGTAIPFYERFGFVVKAEKEMEWSVSKEEKRVAIGAITKSFSVSCMHEREMHGYSSDLSEWQTYAHEMVVKAEREKVDEGIFVDSEAVIQTIRADVERRWSSDTFTSTGATCLACIDTAKRIYAVALVRFEKDEVNLEYLASDPRNIWHPLHTGDVVRGAGSAIMNYLCSQGKTIRLEASETAVPFYSRFGFVLEDADTGAMVRCVEKEEKGA